MAYIFIDAFDLSKPIKKWKSKGKNEGKPDFKKSCIVRGPIQFLSAYPIGKCEQHDVQWEIRAGNENCPDCGTILHRKTHLKDMWKI